MSTIDKKDPGVRLFYADNRLVCQVGPETTRLMRAGGTALAQLQALASLLQSDGANTVLAAHAHGQSACQAYSAYGFSPAQTKLAMIGFTGEWRDERTGCYPLGKGHRLFSPLLCRLAAPDVLSPFDRGGLNAYAYCAGDPVNYSDPSGQLRVSFSGMAKAFGAMKKTGATALLRENKAPMSLKPFIRHLAQEPDGVTALLAVPIGNGLAVTKLTKLEGKLHLGRPDNSFVENFVDVAAVQKDGHIFAVDRGRLPTGVKGYEYLSSSDNTPHFTFRRTNRSDNHPLPSYEDLLPPAYGEHPPSYAYATTQASAIRKASS
ncbi:RHS repeat-associated core domain-containing protein [Pseudomonas sp. NPDC090592]|uniref:RHS repeat-associated core domain-containing protein n=1 Tax=Pseudomonas sp. NPDC090592 TaxID=3364480 RepID=UPI00383A3532